MNFLSFFRFYQSTALSSRPVDGHQKIQMYFGGSVVGTGQRSKSQRDIGLTRVVSLAENFRKFIPIFPETSGNFFFHFI